MKLDWSFLHRRKKYDVTNLHSTKLSRVLSLVDITALGISCTLGNGIYVLAGDVIANYAGPAIVLSFIISGLATCIAGLCYAEFGARVPRSGSAYVYIYVTIGEFVAFVLGWDLILEYVIGVSSGASALSGYIDSLLNNKIQDFLRQTFPINIEGFASYPDFLSFFLVLLITVLMVVGVKESSFLNKIFTGLNIAVIMFIIISGLLKTQISNWQVHTYPSLHWTDSNGLNQTCATSDRCGNGGFFPFGFSGVIKGAAKTFYAYIGFDAICSTGEEVNNPKRSIPISIIITLLTVSLCYCTTSIILTLMIPYYIIDPFIPFPQAFDYVGFTWEKYIVSVGAIASLATCLYASMFPMPRVVYSLSSDGLIFRFLSFVMPQLKTPVNAAISSGLFAGILTLIFDLDQLIDMMSIGTLMAYSVVSICVLVLRYRPSDHESKSIMNEEEGELRVDKRLIYKLFGQSSEPILKRMFKPSSQLCNSSTSSLVNGLTAIAVADIIALSILLTFIDMSKIYSIVIVCLLVIFLSAISYAIFKQPQDKTINSFKIPLVFILPFLSVLVNLYLMLALSLFTWIRFGVWFVLAVFIQGLIVYFSYGIRKSSENPKNKNAVMSISNAIE